jgi:UDP-N-acetylmuramoyl-tripeptide--D-alanyl-D-alanine ligase
VDAIADAKAEILEGARPSTLLVANADDHRVMARTAGFGGRVTTFGVDREADVQATAVDDRGVEGTRARVQTRRGDVDVAIPLIGRGNVSNVLAAMAVALELDVPLDAMPARIARLSPPPHRGAVLKLASGATVVDDSYNANPTATRRALEVIARTPARRRIAILGEMLELGDHAVALHEDVGRAAQREGVDLLMAVGGAPAAALAVAAVAAGMPPASVRHVATSDDAAAWAAGEIRAGDLVLVKGSRGVKTDRVVERLTAERR